jgi:hypothetical protein
MTQWKGFIACTALTFFASIAQAQSDPNLVGVGDWSGPLEIRFPGALIENQPVTIQVPSDGCFTSGQRIESGATRIVRDGNSVTIDFYANNPICFSAGDPLGVFTYNQALGAFTAGSYAITARYHYIEEPTAPPFAVLNAPMNVVRGTPAPSILPTLSTVSTWLLVAALSVVGMMRARRRRLRI